MCQKFELFEHVRRVWKLMRNCEDVLDLRDKLLCEQIIAKITFFFQTKFKFSFSVHQISETCIEFVLFSVNWRYITGSYRLLQSANIRKVWLQIYENNQCVNLFFSYQSLKKLAIKKFSSSRSFQVSLRIVHFFISSGNFSLSLNLRINVSRGGKS